MTVLLRRALFKQDMPYARKADCMFYHDQLKEPCGSVVRGQLNLFPLSSDVNCNSKKLISILDPLNTVPSNFGPVCSFDPTFMANTTVRGALSIHGVNPQVMYTHQVFDYLDTDLCSL